MLESFCAFSKRGSIVSNTYVSILSLRSAALKISLFALALVAPLLPATAWAQFTGGPISFTTSDSTAQSSSVTVSGATGTVKTVVVELDGVKSDGVCNAQGPFVITA